jgi:LAO/AO transport system kinase
MSEKTKKPEWAPEQGGEEFASRLMDGVEGGHDGLKRKGDSALSEGDVRRRRDLSIEEHVAGVLGDDRTVLGQTITLVESNALTHQEKAQAVLKALLPHTGKSVRVGVTGAPGAGKSTFIDTMGAMLIERGSKVAVLAVDPSSSRTGGSILGDKTRMERLLKDPNAFIRPSPTSGTLGGVARKSRESMLVCEAAGFDVVLVETVGVGQSETAVRSMVDFFLLLMIPGAGDELQGIKRGVMELADAVVINKADGDNVKRAEAARAEFGRALHYLLPATEGWLTNAYSCSSITGHGIGRIWDVVEDFANETRASGVFEKRRKEQALSWLHAMIEEKLKTDFFSHSSIEENLPLIEKSVASGEIPATFAVERLMEIFKRK